MGQYHIFHPASLTVIKQTYLVLPSEQRKVAPTLCKAVLKQRWLNNKALAVNYYLMKNANIFSHHGLLPITCQAKHPVKLHASTKQIY